MSKEYPYFKFYSHEWISGDITLEDLETQGLFINVCAYYWRKKGDLSLAEIKRRISEAKPNAFDSLISRNIIRLIDDKICIDFLDEQMQEMHYKSAVNSKNGKLGGRPKLNKDNGKNRTLNRSLTERKANAKRNKSQEEEEEEYKKNYKKKFDETAQPKLELTSPENLTPKQIHETNSSIFVYAPKIFEKLSAEKTWLESFLRVYKISENELLNFLKEFAKKIETSGEVGRTIGDAKKYFSNWLSKNIENQKVMSKSDVKLGYNSETIEKLQKIKNAKKRH